MKTVELFHKDAEASISVPASDVEGFARKGWLPAKAKAKAKQPVEEVAGNQED